MIVYILDRDFNIKNTAANENKKYRVIDDRVITEDFCTCELTVRYSGRAADFCAAGEYLYFPSRDLYTNFFQIVSVDVDYLNKTVTIRGDNNLLWLYSQKAYPAGGDYGHVSEIGKTIEWFLSEFTEHARFPYTIKVNELANEYRTGDTTASSAKECLNKTAALFGCEIVFSYLMEDGTIKPFIEIYKQRNGRETGEILTVGNELAELSKNEDVSSVFTSVYIRGGVKASKRYDTVADMQNDEDLERNSVVIAANNPYLILGGAYTVTNTAFMTDPEKIYYYNGTYYRGRAGGTNQQVVTGHTVYDGFAMRLSASNIGQEDYVYTPLPDYDEGDYLTVSGRLISRSMWARFAAPDIGLGLVGYGSEIARNVEDLDTTNQDDILSAALSIMEEKDPVITFECECNKRVSYGAYYTLRVPDEGVYISARCLSIEESETAGTYKPSFGNYVIKENAFEVMARNAK